MDLALKFFPKFHFDKNETQPIINLNKYICNKTICLNSNEPDETVISCITNRADGGKTIYYFLFYLKDCGKNIFGFVIDSHEYDLEYVAIEIDKNESIIGIIFAPHGSKEHFVIRNKSDLSKILEENHANVYISLDKHGMYPVKKVYRLGCFGNDCCDDPRLKALKLELACPEVLSSEYIDGKFVSIPRKLTVSPVTLPEIRLSEVSKRMLFGKLLW